MKVCTTCKQAKPESEYWRLAAALDGLQYNCKDCKRTYDRERRRAQKDPGEHAYLEKPIPAGYVIKGVTQKFDNDGNLTQQYIKTKQEREITSSEERQARLLETFAEMCEPFKVDPAPAPEVASADLINVLPIGDLHVGLRCHLDEVGEEWDLRKAERTFLDAVDSLFESAPPAVEALIVNVGDYMHADNSRGTTTKGTPLDVDSSRWRVMLVALRMFRRCIDRALLTHERVRVICATGNHDGESSLWLRLCLAMVYEREPRVVIVTDPHKFHYYRFGACLFGVTHGDTCKVADLPAIMACDRKEDWAATRHRAWITGHIHHLTVKELPGCVVRSYRSQAKRDKWHDWSGYRSDRDLRLEVWHRDHGQIQEFIHSIRRIK